MMKNMTPWARWIFRGALVAPVLWWTYLGLTGGLGAEPVSKLNTQTGYVTLCLLVLNLGLGIIKSFKKKFPAFWTWLILDRKILGISTGFYLTCHVFFYLAKEGFLPNAFEQILTKTYLFTAFIAAVILWSLTVTSNNLSLRLLKKNWKKLHQAVHIASLFILVHLFLIEKANLILLGLMTLPLVPFQLWRLFRAIKRSRS